MTKTRQRPFIFQCMVNVRSKTCTHEEHNLIIITKERQKPYIVQYTRKHGMVCVKKMWRIDSERRVIFGNDIKPKIKRNRRPKTCNYWEIVHLYYDNSILTGRSWGRRRGACHPGHASPR